MTTILAIDCATGPCSVAIWKGGGVAAYLENLRPSAQSAVLAPMVEEALRKSHMDYRDLSCVAATIGPGSFTGIRVGLALAQGIAFAAGIKSMGFTTLEVLAFSSYSSPRRGEGKILAILNAGKGEYYYQAFENSLHLQPLYGTMLGTLEQAMASAEAAVITGNADAATAAFPRADALAELAAMHKAAAQPLAPFYIRPPDAKLPAKKL